MKLHEYDPNYVGFTKPTPAKSDSTGAFANWKTYQNTLNPNRKNIQGNKYLICGSAGIENRYCIIGIDVDVGENDVTIDQVYKDVKLPKTAVVKTPGGGYHLLYLIANHEIYTASFAHSFEQLKNNEMYIPKSFEKYKGIDFKGNGGLLFTHGTEWTEIKSTKKDKLGKYELIHDIDLAIIDKKKIINFRKYLQLLLDKEKSKIMRLISDVKLPDGAWDDTALDIAGFLKMKKIPMDEAYHIWNSNADLVTIQRQQNKDFIKNTYKKDGGSRYEKAIELIPKLKDYVDKDFGGTGDEKLPNFNVISNEIINIMIEDDNYKYDHINEVVYHRVGHIWKVDNQQEYIYNNVVTLLRQNHYLTGIYDRSIQTIITKFLKTTLSIKINIDDELQTMFSEHPDYNVFELPLRDDVLVVDRDNNTFTKRKYIRDDFFLFKFNADFIFYDDEDQAMNSTPKFMKFMNWFIENEKLMEFTLFGAAMTLIPMYKMWNNMLYFYGSGNNGKSVFMDIIANYYPGYIQSTSRFEEICSRFGFQPVLNKWFIKGEECKPRFDTDLAHIRSLADLARTNVDIKRKNVTEIQLTATGMFNGNTAPILNNDGDFRRISLINCRNKMQKDNPDFDINLTSKIISGEGDAIFTFLIRKATHGMGMLNKIKPKIIDIVRAEVEDAEDPLSYFCDNYISLAKGDINTPPGTASIANIYYLYLQVAKKKGFPKFTKRQVIKKVRTIFKIKGSHPLRIGGAVIRSLLGIELIRGEFGHEISEGLLSEFT